MSATQVATGTVKWATPAFETLLVHLALESHGLNRSGLVKLFCQAARDHVGASGACCSFFSGQAGWIVAETIGFGPWGKPGEALPQVIAQSIELAQTIRKAISSPSSLTEAPGPEDDGEHSAALPFVCHGAPLGGAVLSLQA